MPRLTDSALPAYRKHASGQAVVTLNGKDFYLGKYGSAASRTLYKTLTGEWQRRGRTLPSVEPDERPLSVVELIAGFLDHCRKYYRKGGKVTNEYDCIAQALKPLRKLYGREDANTFGPVKLEVVREEYVTAKHSRGFCNKQTSRIRRLFKWAVSKELVAETVYRALCTLEPLKAGRCNAPERAPITAVSDATIDATLPHLPEVVQDMIRLQRASGMRPGELVILRPMDVDRSDRVVWRYVPAVHKMEHAGKSRVVYLGPKSRGILARYLLRAESDYCFRPCDSESKRRATRTANRKTPVTCGNVVGSNRKRRPKRKPGDCYTVHSYRRAIHRAAEAAGVDTWSPHRIRHAAASAMRREFGEEAARVCLGHSRIDTTRLYGERDERLARQVAEKIG